MNLTFELLTSIIITIIGIYLFQKIQYDYRLVNIFKKYPLPTLIKSGGIIDLDKLYIFVQNFRYRVNAKGAVQYTVDGNIVKILAGPGELEIVFEAWGFLDFYRIHRSIKVVE